MGNETNKLSGNFDFGRRNFLEDKTRLTDERPAAENVFGDSRRERFLGGDIVQFRLSNFFSPTRQPSAPAAPDPRKVAEAVAAIKNSLDQGFTDWDVTHGDLENVQNTFRNLTAEEANQVFEQLSGDDVKNWAQELNGMNGGYSREEKQELFNEIAGKLNGANLTRFAEALGLGDESSDVRPGLADEPDVNMLARAVAENAPDAVKAEFVKTLAAKADRHQDAGAAVAQVLVSMSNNPALLQRTLNDLTDSQLQAVVDGAARKTVANHGVTNYDPEPLAELLNAVAALPPGADAAKQKARLFEMSASKITEIREKARQFGIFYGEPAEATIRNALTQVIDGDTEGVVRALKENYIDGNGITAYLKSLINDGENTKIGELIARLSKGNDLRGDALTRFGERTEDDDAARTRILSNAQVLGYFGGGLLAATRQISGDYKKQSDMLKNIFSTVTGGVGAISTPAGVSGAIINGLSATAVEDIASQLAKGKIKDAEALQRLIIPREANGTLYRGETEKGEFINWSDHVLVSNPAG